MKKDTIRVEVDFAALELRALAEAAAEAETQSDEVTELTRKLFGAPATQQDRRKTKALRFHAVYGGAGSRGDES